MSLIGWEGLQTPSAMVPGSSHPGTRPGIVFLLSPVPPPLLYEFHCLFASLCQAWTMSAMRTSSPTPPPIRFPSSTSSLKDFFSMTRQKVISQEEKLEREVPFFKNGITEVISKLCFHNLIQLPVRPVRSMAIISTYGNRLRGDEKGLEIVVSGRAQPDNQGS